MADRWFGGIWEKANIWSGSTMVAIANLDTYFLSFRVQSDTINKFVQFEIFGEPANSPLPVPLRGFFHPAISASVQFANNTIRKLKEGSGVVPIVTPDAINTWCIAYGTYCWLPKIEGTRTDQVILRSVTESNRKTVAVIYKAPNANLSIGEVQPDPVNKFIVQPAHVGGMWQGAVADELNFVSTSAGDTLLGTGMRKLQFTYWDASKVPHVSAEISLNGLGPVDIIGSYPDVYLINQIWGTEFGSDGHNVGHIFLQDNA